MKGCSAFPKAPASLEPHHQIGGWGLTPLQRYSQYILLPQLTAQLYFVMCISCDQSCSSRGRYCSWWADMFIVFYSMSDLMNKQCCRLQEITWPYYHSTREFKKFPSGYKNLDPQARSSRLKTINSSHTLSH